MGASRGGASPVLGPRARGMKYFVVRSPSRVRLGTLVRGSSSGRRNEPGDESIVWKTEPAGADRGRSHAGAGLGGPGAAAAPASADDDELASTGASVIGLSILGIGALLAGTGALLATRRRSAAAHI